MEATEANILERDDNGEKSRAHRFWHPQHPSARLPNPFATLSTRCCRRSNLSSSRLLCRPTILQGIYKLYFSCHQRCTPGDARKATFRSSVQLYAEVYTNSTLYLFNYTFAYFRSPSVHLSSRNDKVCQSRYFIKGRRCLRSRVIIINSGSVVFSLASLLLLFVFCSRYSPARCVLAKVFYFKLHLTWQAGRNYANDAGRQAAERERCCRALAASEGIPPLQILVDNNWFGR